MTDVPQAHPGELLSALLDGELTEEEAVAVRAHVATCEACAAELDDVRDARRVVRELAAVEPPAGFLAALAAPDVVVALEPRRGRRFATAAAAGAVAAAAVVGVLVVAGGGGDGALDPDLDVAIQQHASTVGALEDDGVISRGPDRIEVETLVPTTAQQQDLEELPSDLRAPQTLERYKLVDAYVTADGVHLLYRRGDYTLSIIERRGAIDFGDLPAGGEQISIAGHRAWRSTDAVDGTVLVVELDDVVLTLIGDGPGGAVLDAASAFAEER